MAENQEQLVKALKTIESQQDDYKENVERLNMISRNTFGLNEAARAVESLQIIA